MHIIGRRKQEVIRVAHNTRVEMIATIAELMEDGWSESTLRWSTWELSDKEGAWVAQNYPDVTIYLPKKDDFLRTKPYIFLSEHVRDIEEEK
ncbi:hypothetical protein BCP78_0130 [Bacillus phage BCP78]|uniref:Uncharacterized protein n=3 Tax=Tsarbombavirus BCP78 TaxID=1985182 RepID=J9PRC4_9CAUD|nr:hypothetical protein BCP78_0130 [Bacillus phage BCP78]YP_009783493.1 hypothetical protein QLX27_gp120 [Bacillus phage BCU4]AEW47137.1 hypothetical protein BCP78_0130 [Bacillus phage BCP78]AEW47626.1 hypothetical protein BCU4_0120 [Bacillus phage BCU4]AQN32509.1 hypothetical protein BCP12_091 [Bacillus phage BCP12]